MGLVEKKKLWKNASEWASKVGRHWNQTTTEDRKAKKEMDRKEESRVRLLRFFFSSCVPSYVSGVHHFGWNFCVCDCFWFNHRSSHILSLWLVHAGCVFVASFHPSRIWLSGSFESVRWNVLVHRLDLDLCSHPKEFFREWSQNPCELPREKSLQRSWDSMSGGESVLLGLGPPLTLCVW